MIRFRAEEIRDWIRFLPWLAGIPAALLIAFLIWFVATPIMLIRILVKETAEALEQNGRR